MANLQDTDLILVGREGTSFKTQYSDLKDSLSTDIVGDIDLDAYAQLSGATFTGDVTAPYFIGDGSQLTNLPQPTIDYTRSEIGALPSKVWLHIKNIRGGILRLNTRYASALAVHALYQGAAVPWARDEDGNRHYGNSLFLAGRLNMDNSESDVLPYGDASHATRNQDGDPDNDAARALITEWGFDPDNFCGLYDYNDEWIELSDTIEIDGQEVPNTFEYIVYLNDESDFNNGDKLYSTNGTFEIGEYTFTANKVRWEKFFYQLNYVPNLQHLDTSGGTNFKEMFYQATLSNTLGIGTLDVSKGENFVRCFHQAKDFDANLSSWDMSNATDVEQMFDQTYQFSCNRRSLKDTGLDTWNLENVTNVNRFIYQCDSFEHDMSSVRMPNIDRFRVEYNERCPLRMPNGQLELHTNSGARTNEPWATSRSSIYPDGFYWSCVRALKNPVVGATGALDTERKKVCQDYIDFVDAKVEAEEWQSWDKQWPEGGNSASKDESKDKVRETLDLFDALPDSYDP